MMTERDALELAPSLARSMTGIAVLAALAALLLNAAVTQGAVAQAVMIGCAVLALAVALSVWRGRHDHLRWTNAGLVDATGGVVAARDDIVAVDRNPLSLKPSNGFNLRLRTQADRAWRPGLYWRIGRRVGVGGLTSPAAAKALADRIALDTAAPTGGADRDSQ